MAQKDSFFVTGKKQKGGDSNHEKTKESKKAETKNKRHNTFDTSRDVLSDKQQVKQGGAKKPFDKKAYRLKKYSKKYKLEQFEEQRKKKILHNYQKTLKNDMSGSYKPRPFDEDTTDSYQSSVGTFVRHPNLMKDDSEKKSDNKSKKEPFSVAKEHFKKIKQENLEKKEQAQKAQEERAEKHAEYKKKKQERYKKLSAKNKKGQPIMALRMEMILNKIQSGSN